MNRHLLTLLIGVGLPGAVFAQVPVQPGRPGAIPPGTAVRADGPAPEAQGPFTAHCFCAAGPGQQLNLGQIHKYQEPLPQKPTNQADCRNRCAAALQNNAQFNDDAYWCGRLGNGTHTSAARLTLARWLGRTAVQRAR